MQTFFKTIISMLEDFAIATAKTQTDSTRIQSSIHVPDHAKPALIERMDAKLSTRAISTMPLPTALSSDSINKKRRQSDDSSPNEPPPSSSHTTSNTSVSTNSASTNSTRIQRKSTSKSLVSSRDTNNFIIGNTNATRTLPDVVESDIMLVDTGSSNHMASHQSYVRDFKENNAQLSPPLDTVGMGNGSTAVIDYWSYPL